MKPYNEDKYWIMSNYVTMFEANTDTFKDALMEYRDHIDQFGVSISLNAIKHMEYDGYNGYWLTGKTLIVDRSANVCCTQYIDVHIRVRAFEEIEIG